MAEDDDEQALHFEFQVPDEFTVGVYSNLAAIWNSPHDFTIDFAVTGQPEGSENAIHVPARVVARVKIPVTAAEGLLQALADHITKYERSNGPILPPARDPRRGGTPDDDDE